MRLDEAGKLLEPGYLPMEAGYVSPIWTGHLIHLVRDTDYGCEMRSRFWFGDYEPDIATTREQRMELVPDRLGWGLVKHCHEEMSYLAGFLPDLFARETS